MRHITNNITTDVSNGEMTIAEAEKFIVFLKHQRWQIDEAESKRRDEAWEKQRGG